MRTFNACVWTDRLPKEEDHSEPWIPIYRDFPSLGLAKAWVEKGCRGAVPNASGSGTVTEHDSSDIFRDNDTEYEFDIYGSGWRKELIHE